MWAIGDRKGAVPSLGALDARLYYGRMSCEVCGLPVKSSWPHSDWFHARRRELLERRLLQCMYVAVGARAGHELVFEVTPKGVVTATCVRDRMVYGRAFDRSPGSEQEAAQVAAQYGRGHLLTSGYLFVERMAQWRANVDTSAFSLFQ